MTIGLSIRSDDDDRKALYTPMLQAPMPIAVSIPRQIAALDALVPILTIDEELRLGRARHCRRVFQSVCAG